MKVGDLWYRGWLFKLGENKIKILKQNGCEKPHSTGFVLNKLRPSKLPRHWFPTGVPRPLGFEMKEFLCF